MPLWLVYHPEWTFTTTESKQALAADITSIYTAGGLPAFYVVVNFIPLSPGSCYVGGQAPSKPFIRLTVDHLAVHFVDDKARALRMITKIDQVLKPHIADKGYDWEFSIDETPREFWKINGFIPPPHKSQAEKMWADLNKAVEYQDQDASV